LAEIEQAKLARITQRREVEGEKPSPAGTFRQLVLPPFDKLSDFLHRGIRSEMRGWLGRLIVHGFVNL
jgi:hypothetical protein